ncbi:MULTISPECIES: DMT family transporter [unclassified Methanoregula]|uniref:DMT family transporter n=1 Tax=unclassified Methanoregula TaxID=2649730 RepID=UPI0009CF3D60|nr:MULTISPECIES: DMT family transporter [unclassified Methanoregula]OPX65209.1 MAG: EamA-like transporter family protein [Methanoregula sp. PtaB.Bin085]OPY32118.1 MAG: EamA-like transporter family protein [Methanoregula sp. PtaU1.Bin006]
MLWVFLAIIGAIANAGYFIIIKNNIATRNPWILNAIGLFLAGILLLCITALNGFPAIGPDYAGAVIISGILNIIGLSLIFRAMESSDLSLSMPMLSFTPVFLIGTSYLLLNEVPSMAGILGICIIVSGSYVLNISAEHEYILDPVRSMVQNRGSWFMLIVALLFAASINYDKIAMLNSDPVFGMAFTLLIISGAFSLSLVIPRQWGGDRSFLPPGWNPVAPVTPPVPEAPFRSYLVPAVLIGIAAVAESISINMAYTLQIAPYVIALKRLSIIFMVLYGTIICAEHEIRTRILGSVLMVGGAVIILIFA